MNEPLALEVVVLDHGRELPMPRYETSGSAGMDLMAAVDEAQTLLPGERMLVPTGLSVAIPPGYEGQVRSRSGLSLKHGIVCPNSPGTVDSDYRGELRAIVANWGTRPFVIERGMRIAQLVLSPVVQATWRPVERLSETTRGSGGFGSTGVGASARV